MPGYIRKITIPTALITLISLCYALGNSEPPPQKDDFQLTLSLSKKQAVPGDTVWFTLLLANSSDDTLHFKLPSPLVARFVIYSDERPVWRSDFGISFAQVITPFAIPPKNSIPMRAFWLGKNNEADWLPLGKYYIEACFNATKQCLRDSMWLVD